MIELAIIVCLIGQPHKCVSRVDTVFALDVGQCERNVIPAVMRKFATSTTHFVWDIHCQRAPSNRRIT